MLDDWKRAWQKAVENFEHELNAPAEDFASPSARNSAMSRDLQAARAVLNRLQAEVVAAGKDLAGEEESERTARRRAELAQRIDDADTVRIALEFAERHAFRAGILRRKVEVLQEELTMRQAELVTMEEQAGPEVNKAPPRTVIDDLLERQKQDAEFRRIDRERREKEADARLEELKKKMK